jgi:hypothetical protein
MSGVRVRFTTLVSIIGLILFGQNYLYVKMLFYKGFRYSEVFQKILHCLQVKRFPVPYQPFGRSCHPVQTLICPLFHPSGQHALLSEHPDRTSIIRPDDVVFRPDPLLYREATVPSYICPDISAARPDAAQYSNKLQILSKFIYEKIDATVRKKWIPVWTRSYIRQESQLKYHRPDVSQLGPKARSIVKEIADSTSTVRTTAYHGPNARTTDMEIAC